MGFGIALIVLGLGSIALKEFTDYQFILLSWADDWQPLSGIGIALVGVIITLVVARQRRAKAPASE